MFYPATYVSSLPLRREGCCAVCGVKAKFKIYRTGVGKICDQCRLKIDTERELARSRHASMLRQREAETLQRREAEISAVLKTDGKMRALNKTQSARDHIVSTANPDDVCPVCNAAGGVDPNLDACAACGQWGGIFSRSGCLACGATLCKKCSIHADVQYLCGEYRKRNVKADHQLFESNKTISEERFDKYFQVYLARVRRARC